MMDKTIKICPKCGQVYTEHSSLSRTDNRTEICPDCGVRQALGVFGMDKNRVEEIIDEINKEVNNKQGE